MIDTWFYAILSVFVVSLISLIGILVLSVKIDKLRGFLLLFVSFAAGSMLGDAFIHLLPEAVNEYGFGLDISLYVIFGIASWFLVEKIIHWHHCHEPACHGHVHSFAIMNLFGDSVHNFIDGIIIGSAYLVSFPVGLATTIAVILHEIPQEISDFGVLIYGGFSKNKAILYNFLTALTATAGAIIALILGTQVEGATKFFIPFAAGSFIYIAGADLIPELHKESNTLTSVIQFLFLLLGIGVMLLLLLID